MQVSGHALDDALASTGYWLSRLEHVTLTTSWTPQDQQLSVPVPRCIAVRKCDENEKNLTPAVSQIAL